MNCGAVITKMTLWLFVTGHRAPVPAKNSRGDILAQVVYSQSTRPATVAAFQSCQVPAFFYPFLSDGHSESQGTAGSLRWVCINDENPLFGKWRICTVFAVCGGEELGNKQCHPVSHGFSARAETSTSYRRGSGGMQRSFSCAVCPPSKYLFYCSYWNTFTNIFWQSKPLFWKHWLGLFNWGKKCLRNVFQVSCHLLALFFASGRNIWGYVSVKMVRELKKYQKQLE